MKLHLPLLWSPMTLIWRTIPNGLFGSLMASSILRGDTGECYGTYGSVASVPLDEDLPIAEARRQAVEELERQYIKNLISRKHGTMKQCAEQAGITTRQINKLMAKYGIRIILGISIA